MTGPETTPYSLVPFGMEQKEEDDVLFYFKTAEPKDWAERERWEPLYQTRHYESELEGQLRNFYQFGLLSWAVESKAAEREHDKLFPDIPMPPMSIQPEWEAPLSSRKWNRRSSSSHYFVGSLHSTGGS